MVESLLFIGAGVGAGEKNTRSRSRLKTDRLHNTEQFNKRNPSIVNLLTQKKNQSIRHQPIQNNEGGQKFRRRDSCECELPTWLFWFWL